MPGLVAAAQNPNAGVANNTPDVDKVLLSTSVDILDDQGNNIGYVSQFSDSGNRRLDRIRHLNALDAGRTLEMAPGPEDRTLSLNGFAIYNRQTNGSLIQRIGGESTRKAMKTLEEQKLPFTIVEREVDPATGEEEYTIYHECWIQQMSKPVNIGQATVSQSCTVQVGWVE